LDSSAAAFDWTRRLPARRRRQKHISLNDAAQFSADRETNGWFVSAVGQSWRIGRRSDSGNYELVSGEEPVTFKTMLAAETYLDALLQPPR